MNNIETCGFVKAMDYDRVQRIKRLVTGVRYGNNSVILF